MMVGKTLEKEVNGHVFEARRIDDLFVANQIALKLIVAICPIAEKATGMVMTDGVDDASNIFMIITAAAAALNTLPRDEMNYCINQMLMHVYVKTGSGYKPVSDGTMILHQDKIGLDDMYHLLYMSYLVNFSELVKKNVQALLALSQKQNTP